MPQYLVCNYLPDDFDPSTVTEEMIEEIHALNRECKQPGHCGLISSPDKSVFRLSALSLCRRPVVD